MASGRVERHRFENVLINRPNSSIGVAVRLSCRNIWPAHGLVNAFADVVWLLEDKQHLRRRYPHCGFRCQWYSTHRHYSHHLLDLLNVVTNRPTHLPPLHFRQTTKLRSDKTRSRSILSQHSGATPQQAGFLRLQGRHLDRRLQVENRRADLEERLNRGSKVGHFDPLRCKRSG